MTLITAVRRRKNAEQDETKLGVYLCVKRVHQL